MTEDSTEHRGNARTSLFAAAVLDLGSTRIAVRIRNISPTGALIQGDELPPTGTPVRLIRGSLSATGEIRWSRAPKAGLSFGNPIRVTEWLASCASKAHQQSVDDIIAAVRTSTRSMASGFNEAAPLRARPLSEAVSRDLLQVEQMVSGVAEHLAADPLLLGRHGGDIQQLDAAASILAALRNENRR